MSEINKRLDERDANQIQQAIYNRVNATISVDGFIVGKVGNRITRAVTTTNVANDTEVYTYFDGANQLIQLTIVYTDATLQNLISVQRTA